MNEDRDGLILLLLLLTSRGVTVTFDPPSEAQPKIGSIGGEDVNDVRALWATSCQAAIASYGIIWNQIAIKA